jgi:hypothetical protein
MAAIEFSHSYETTTCCKCGVAIVMPDVVMKRFRSNHESFFCVYGHSQRFTAETEADRLKREKESLEKRLAWKTAEADGLERRRRAAVAQATKAKNKLGRVANGVCPCCKRSFQNLMRHMQTKHPSFREGLE